MDKVEEKLNEIVGNTKSKESFSITLTGQGSRLEKTFEPEISVASGCHYEIAFTSLETYYSMPNINPTNNCIQVSKSGAGTWRNIELDTGCYGLMDINKEVQRQLKENGLTKAVEFIGNYNTFKCVMIIRPGFAVSFAGGRSMHNVLGFEEKTYKAYVKQKRFISEHTVKILVINSILVHCDLVGSSYLNGKPVPVIHSFFPLADVGMKIVEKPSQHIYLPVSSDVIRRIAVWLTDQDQNLLDLREETLTVKFHLRSC